MKFQFSSSATGPSAPSEGIAGKGCGTLFFAIFLLVGMMFVVVIGGEAVRDAAPWLWTEVGCTIISSTVEETGDDENPYRPAVHYRYEFKDRSHDGTNLTRRDGGTANYDAARNLADRYPPGATASCRVDPDHPQVSVLERRFPWIAFAILFPMIFVAIGGGGLYATWRGARAEREGELNSISQRAKGSNGRRFLIGLGAVFIIIGGLVFAFLFAIPALRLAGAAGWEPVQATIVRSTVRSWSTDDGTSYRPDVLYEYRAGGRIWRSNRVTFFSALSSGRSEARSIRDLYGSGTSATCWVDPSDPSASVLERSFRPRYLLGLLPLLFVVAGAAAARWGWTGPGVKKRRTTGEPGPPVVDEYSTRVEEPLQLEPQLSPVGKLLGTIFFALFWNGIVSVFVWQAWQSWERGRPDWFLTIFLVPFVLVGLATVAFVGHFALALANPRPRITLQRGEPCLGDELQVEWQFTGRSSRLSHLKILIEGREEATYRRGTDTHTDTEVFATMTLVDTRNDWEIPRGSTSTVIPNDTMHSFAASNNKVVWEIKVEGEILRWPDVNQNFPITLHPLRIKDV